MNPVVGDAEWEAARRELLAREKAHRAAEDELAAARRDLPWRRVSREYVFEDSEGPVTLSTLFGSSSQLIVYHFMFGPDWDEGCKSCSFGADHFDRSSPHLAARDVALVAVSRAPVDRLHAFRQRMGWTFRWVSSLGSPFNFDFGVSFTPESLADGSAVYNYRAGGFPAEEAPGVSVFARGDDGAVYHTYSSYARGLEPLLGAYPILDWVPRGRNEAGLPYTMAWVRHRDRYGEGA